MKCVFTFEPLEQLKTDLVASYPDVQFYFYENMTLAEQEMKSAEVIVTYGEDLVDEHIYQAEKLKWIMVTSAGLERMPLKAIKEKNILVTNARGIHKIPMAEFTLGIILSHAKGFQRLWENQKEAVWDKQTPLTEIHEQSLLIVGAGAIGQEIARLAKPFGMKIIGVNSRGNAIDHFDEMYTLETIQSILGSADYIVSILPSTEETIHFYQPTHFEGMKKSAVFINIGRGDVVQEEVLMTALNNQEISHAYLDVFAVEPLPKSHTFWKMSNVTVTPHISSTTMNYLPRALEIFRKNLHTYMNNDNEFINVIDPERGY